MRVGWFVYAKTRRMIRLSIRELAERRGITTAYQLQKLLNVNPAIASRLWKGEQRMISLKTINEVCNALDCGPEALFDYVPDKKRKFD